MNYSRNHTPTVNREAWLVVPVLVVLVVCFIAPLAVIVSGSVTEVAPGEAWFANYVAYFDSPVYLRILLQTVRVALTVTLLTLILGYPYAYLMHMAPRPWSVLLIGAVLFPFWSNLLVRTYSWTVILQDTGIINRLLAGLGLAPEPLSLMRNTLGVMIGMSYILLPFMVLPLYTVMRRIDPAYLIAASGLGAPPLLAFVRVYLPLSAPGIISGCLIVFVLSIGFYITPALLGGPRDTMLGEQIVIFLNEVQSPGLAYVAAVLLLVLVLAILAVSGRMARSLGGLRLE